MTHAPIERSAGPAPVTNLSPAVKAGRRSWRRVLLVLGPLVLVVGGGLFYLTSGRFVSTDDAYIRSRILQVNADVAGQAVRVPVRDNQPVKAGQVLVEIDPEPYRLKLAASDAELARVVQDAEALRATVGSQQGDLTQAAADVAYYRGEFARQQKLVASGAVARSGYDKAERDLIAAQARQASLNQQIRSNLAQLGGSIDTPTEHLPSYLSALAARDTAAYNLDHATVKAAQDGRVGTVTLRPGEYVAPGEALFPLIVQGDTWIEANVRETDLTHVQAGQTAEFTVDAYPGRRFQARVESFSPATGSELSVLPAENATGNWVKIVQRLPLKLLPEIDPGDPQLHAGLSVNVEIDTGTYPHLPAFLGAILPAGPATPAAP
jgi:membrane fusion protein (multidrug efflux system)